MILIWVSKVYIFQCLTNFLSKFLIISVLHVYIRTGESPRRNWISYAVVIIVLLINR